MPPPVPPPPPLNKLSTNANNNVAKLKKSKNEPTDVNALLSQIRQGHKLKKTTQINDRSAPIVTGRFRLFSIFLIVTMSWWIVNGSAVWIFNGLTSFFSFRPGAQTKSTGNQSETKPITPSMFKNGTNPLNLNFKLPTPLGAPSLVNSTANKKPNQSSSNLNSSLSSAKSSLSTVSTISSKSNASFNSSVSNIAKSLTLRSPSKSVIATDNKSVTSTKSELLNKSVLSTKSDRPTVRPPPLPLKPPAINRRQSFDSGQLNVKQSKTQPGASANKPMGINPIKPPPPPRFATMRPQVTPNSDNSSQLASSQAPARQHKSTQNLSALGSTTANSTSNSSLSYSTMKIKANTKNYPSTQRPLGAPPPPPVPKAPSAAVSAVAPNFLNSNNMQSSSLSYSSSQFNSAPPNIPKPPPLPAHLSSAPLPPSLTSVNPMSNLSSLSDNSNNFYETIGSPSSLSRNTSKGIYLFVC